MEMRGGGGRMLSAKWRPPSLPIFLHGLVLAAHTLLYIYLLLSFSSLSF